MSCLQLFAAVLVVFKSTYKNILSSISGFGEQAASMSNKHAAPSDWVQDVVFKSTACRHASGQTCCFDPDTESLFTLWNCPPSWSSQNATGCCCGKINPPRIVPDPRWAWPPIGSLTRRHLSNLSRQSWVTAARVSVNVTDQHHVLRLLNKYHMKPEDKPLTPGQILPFKPS